MNQEFSLTPLLTCQLALRNLHHVHSVLNRSVDRILYHFYLAEKGKLVIKEKPIGFIQKKISLDTFSESSGLALHKSIAC